MFQQLASLLNATTALQMIISGSAEKMTIAVVPKTTQGHVGNVENTPLVLTASAAELDIEFLELLGKFSATRKSLQEQLAASEAVMNEAKKEAGKKASDCLNKHSTTESTSLEAEDDDNEGDHSNQSSVQPAASAPPPSGLPTNLFSM